jgi:elongation factor 1-alpha
VPISSYKGDNITKPSGNLGWYKGHSIVDALNTLKQPPKPTDKPLRLPIQDCYDIKGVGQVPVGRIETGVMKPGMKLSFQPADKVGEVKTIEMHHEQMAEAGPGDNVGFNIRGIEKGEIRRGDVAGPVDHPPTVAKSFTAQIIVLNHPSVITPGYTPVFHAHTAQVACTFEEIVRSIDQRTGATKQEKPEYIKTGDAAVVKIRPTKPMVIESFKVFPQLGRFAIRDMGQTVAAGQVIDVEPR